MDVGDIVVLPAEDVLETDLSIEDGISVILSAGAFVPDIVGQVAPKSGRVSRSAVSRDLESG